MNIQQIQTKDGQDISLGKFTVLVGPNNVGKSQTLKDIHQKMTTGPKARGTIVTEISVEKPSRFEDLLDGLVVIKDDRNIDQRFILGISSNLTSGEKLPVNLTDLKNHFSSSNNLDFTFGNIGKFRVSYLDAGSRLVVAKTMESYNPHIDPPQNLLQALFGADPDPEPQLRDVFQKMFGIDIRLDYSGMKQLTMRVAQEFGDIPDDPRKAYPIFSKFRRLDDQGDGFRSFVGVVLSLLLSQGRVLLLDEPEAFLHPTQARQLGRWIAEHSAEVPGQIIIATHNASFLSGILSTDQAVNIYRLNRQDDITSYTLMSPEATDKLAKSPLLSSQPVLEAIFYEGVVVCEADADRVVYQTVAVREHEAEEILFVHAHNKQTLHRVVSLLQDAQIPVCAVADIDILNAEDELRRIIKAMESEWDSDEILALRESVESTIEAESEESILSRVREAIREFLEQLEAGDHTVSGVRSALGRIRGLATRWSDVKKEGISALPREAKGEAAKLIQLSSQKGFFIVPVGELEGWMDLGTSKKNRWIVRALEALFNHKCPAELKWFVKEMLDYLDGHSDAS